jgi:hypothetical protein
MSLVSNFAFRFILAIALLSAIASANSPQSNKPQPSTNWAAETPDLKQGSVANETPQENSEETQPDDDKKHAGHSDAERMGEILESLEHDQKQLLALEQEIIQKRGSWLSYKGTQVAQGRDAAKEVLRNDPALYAEIEALVKEKLGIKGGVTTPPPVAAPITDEVP